ncbi:cell division protein FtsQ [Amylibacter sp. SFDW26]|uniref:cell division protein FtsQ/DivIB n=1 Tax=Amylibacter sp. SFDW26 TaxID=2652722 RepID=UPI001261A58C|nr:cell division protein FtsQ/DivIB [Amylibacter sp. SFDW26]KAB7610331.1 cell division protein FtsQ [Amylibacter sp. SFDW26]
MQQITPPTRQDPAPSRVKYKLERLWLTPVYRALIRTGLPVLFVGIIVVSYVRDPAVQANMITHYNHARTVMEERPEFMVKQMRIQGVGEITDSLVRAALPVEFPVSSFHLDLEALKASVESIEGVEAASILVGAQGVLEVGIVERVPALIWRNDEGLVLLDASGEKSGRLGSRLDRPELPLVTGVGVEQSVPEAMDIFAKLAPVAGRVRGLMRIGERRWDVVLDRNQILRLPEDKPLAALERIFALHAAQDILNRDVAVVDVRDGRKPILRLSAPALDGLKKLRLIANGEDS